MKRLTVGIFAHVDAGKTTLSEALLYRCGAIRTQGRVDHGDAYLDTHAIERERGITIYSKQAIFVHEGFEITLVDTPGHVDFTPETERVLPVLDTAILVVSALDGVQSHTKTLWRLLEEYRVPTVVFVNKMDQAHTEQAALVEDVQQRLSERCLLYQPDDQAFFESASMASEEALEEYLDSDTLRPETVRRLSAQRLLFPVLLGSALQGQGIDPLLDALCACASQPAWPACFGARVFKITHDSRKERLAWLKVTGGTLRAKQVLRGQMHTGGSIEEWEQKVNQIRLYHGEKFTAIEEAPAGQVCAVTGLDHVMAGDCLGCEDTGKKPVIAPVMCFAVELGSHDASTALGALLQLAEEDPMLNAAWDADVQEIRLQLMGAVHLEVIKQTLLDRFGLDLGLCDGSVLYKETILEPVEGIGHFEPLRHYAEAHILLEPLPAGSGLQFGSVCSEDELDRNWQRLIATHLVERQHKGVLAGYPLTDMRMTILAGRAHAKHTNGGDFRQATYRAIRQGLMKASCVLLEPWYSFELSVPQQLVGRAMADIQRMSGTFQPPITRGEDCILKGVSPASEMQSYALDLASYSHGKGSISYVLDGYRPCHNAAEIIADRAYDAQADLENSPDSVFCSHGAGFTVSWDEVDQHAHVDSNQVSKTPYRVIDEGFFAKQ